jgi:hypothetical protein
VLNHASLDDIYICTMKKWVFFLDFTT